MKREGREAMRKGGRDQGMDSRRRDRGKKGQGRIDGEGDGEE